MFFSNEQSWLSQDDAYDLMSISISRERFCEEQECKKPSDKKQHCHLHYADVLLLKKDFEESIASVFQKNEYFPHEWISSSNVFSSMLCSCCKNWPCEDNEADADLRVSSESKYSFFKQMVIQHIVEMDVVVINRSLTSFSRSREERVWSSPKPGMLVVSLLRVFFLSWP